MKDSESLEHAQNQTSFDGLSSSSNSVNVIPHNCESISEICTFCDVFTLRRNLIERKTYEMLALRQSFETVVALTFAISHSISDFRMH